MKKILQLVLALTVISAICAAVLALVNSKTKDRIASLTAEKTANAAKAVLPADVKATDTRPDPARDADHSAGHTDHSTVGTDHGTVRTGHGTVRTDHGPCRSAACRSTACRSAACRSAAGQSRSGRPGYSGRSGRRHYLLITQSRFFTGG